MFLNINVLSNNFSVWSKNVAAVNNLASLSGTEV